MGPFDLAGVLVDAQREESLADWGPGEFERPLGVLLDDYARADLNAIGTHVLRSGIVHSLRLGRRRVRHAGTVDMLNGRTMRVDSDGGFTSTVDVTRAKWPRRC